MTLKIDWLKYVDPYYRCERNCNHDLTAGILVTDLLKKPGPWPDTIPVQELVRPPRR